MAFFRLDRRLRVALVAAALAVTPACSCGDDDGHQNDPVPDSREILDGGDDGREDVAYSEDPGVDILDVRDDADVYVDDDVPDSREVDDDDGDVHMVDDAPDSREVPDDAGAASDGVDAAGKAAEPPVGIAPEPSSPGRGERSASSIGPLEIRSTRLPGGTWRLQACGAAQPVTSYRWLASGGTLRMVADDEAIFEPGPGKGLALVQVAAFTPRGVAIQVFRRRRG